MTRAPRILALPVVMGALVLAALRGAVPQTDPEPFPYHQPLALATVAADPEPFPRHADDRVKVRYPWLPAEGATNLV